MPTPENATANLLRVLSDRMLLDSLAPSLNCGEAEVFADFLRTHGLPDAADDLIRVHAEQGDDPGEHDDFLRERM